MDIDVYNMSVNKINIFVYSNVDKIIDKYLSLSTHEMFHVKHYFEYYKTPSFQFVQRRPMLVSVLGTCFASIRNPAYN